MRLSESAYVIPITQARVHFGVICRVETSIGSVDWMKKRKQVDTAEDTRERPVEQGSQLVEITGQSINVSDELDLIFQRRTISSDGAELREWKLPHEPEVQPEHF